MSEALRAGYKLTEVGVIPEDWEVTQLDQLGKFKNGINKSSEAFGHGYPFINLMDVFGVCSISSNEAFGLVDTNYSEHKTYDLRKGDVIFIRSSVKPSGVGLTAVIEKNLEKTVYSGFLIRFRDNGILDIDFKKYCFSENRFRNTVIAASSVSANTNINQDNLKRLLLAVPPKKQEQRAIATALSDIDTLLAKLDTLIAKKRNIKQATMQQLLTGQTRLPGYQILSGTKQTELGVLPLDWSIKFLKEIATVKGGKRLPLGTSVVDKVTPHPYLRVTDMLAGGIDLNDIKYVPDDVFLYIKNYRISIEDIFISVAGTLGIVGKIPTVLDGANLTENANKITSISCDRDFLLYNLMSDRIQGIIESAKTVGAQPKLAIARIEKFAIALPSSRAEQTAIAAALSDMDAELTALEVRREKTREIKQGMMQELLTGRIRLV